MAIKAGQECRGCQWGTGTLPNQGPPGVLDPLLSAFTNPGPQEAKCQRLGVGGLSSRIPWKKAGGTEGTFQGQKQCLLPPEWSPGTGTSAPISPGNHHASCGVRDRDPLFGPSCFLLAAGRAQGGSPVGERSGLSGLPPSLPEAGGPAPARRSAHRSRSAGGLPGPPSRPHSGSGSRSQRSRCRC